MVLNCYDSFSIPVLLISHERAAVDYKIPTLTVLPFKSDTHVETSLKTKILCPFWAMLTNARLNVSFDRGLMLYPYLEKQLWHIFLADLFDTQDASGWAEQISSPARIFCAARIPFPFPGLTHRSILGFMIDILLPAKETDTSNVKVQETLDTRETAKNCLHP